MADGFSRRGLLAAAAKAMAALALGGNEQVEKRLPIGRRPRNPGPGRIAVTTGTDRATAIAATVDALGGMSAFVRADDFVVLKPNAAWSRTPEQAATTHPDTVAAVVQLCKEAGAKGILVIDHTIDRPEESVMTLTGIKSAAESAGARVGSVQDASSCRRISVKGGKSLSGAQVIRDILKADVFINLPTAKVHSDTTVSLGMKNLMGAVWDPQAWHTGAVSQCIADFASAVVPDLVILDAFRLLTSNGPNGPGDTRDLNQIIAGTDQVAVDACGASLFGLDPRDVEHIRLAAECGLGSIDFESVRVQALATSSTPSAII